MIRITLRNAPRLITYYHDKELTVTSVNRTIITSLGRLGLFELVKRTPVFSGELLKSLRLQYYNFGLSNSAHLTFRARDPFHNGSYVYYAEYGRGSAVARNSPKKWMRYWKTPNLAKDPLNSRNVVFAKKVGPAKGHFMVRDTKELLSKEIRSVASAEVERWLQK